MTLEIRNKSIELLQVCLTSAAANAKITIKEGKHFGFLLPGFKDNHSSRRSHGLLREASAICRYLSDGSSLLPSDLLQSAVANQQLAFIDETVVPQVNQYIRSQKISTELKKALSQLNLSGKQSLVDVVAFGALYPIFGPGGSNSSDLPQAISQWFNKLAGEKWVKSGLQLAKISSAKDIEVPVSAEDGYETDEDMPQLAWPNGYQDDVPDLVYPDGYDPNGYDSGLETDDEMPNLVWPRGYNPQAAPADLAWRPAIPIGHTAFSWRRPGVKGPTTQTTPTQTTASHTHSAASQAHHVEEKKSGGVVLPVPGQRNILITSALPYVNNVPHLGNLIGCVLSADVFARFCRLRGHNAIYICGTDEYGTATENKAQEEKVTPQEICNRYFKIHKEIYEWFQCSFDYFGRTSTPLQTKIAQDIFKKNDANGLVSEDTVEQLFCDQCQRFLADRFVEGTCPFCKYEDARGDQCDNCAKLFASPVELVNPRCKIHRVTPAVRSTKHLFLDLPKVEQRLSKWVEETSQKGFWSSNSIAVAKDWLNRGLKPRCITRDLKWGTPVPREGYSEKVFYVWFDAPIGYLSITAGYTPEWEKWWKNPKDVELFQFMGKDNIPFHCIIFPSSLLGTGDSYTLLHHISTTEYLNYENGKFSKSRGTGVFGDDARNTGIPVEVWRFYLLYNRPEKSDSTFVWTDFSSKLNSVLLPNYGNLVNRILTFTFNSLGGVVPKVGTLLPEDEQLITGVSEQLQLFVAYLEKVAIKDALQVVLQISGLGNAYMQHQEPWAKMKDPSQRSRVDTVVGVLLNVVYLLAVVSEPFMPSVTTKIFNMLQLPFPTAPLAGDHVAFRFQVPPGHVIGKPEVLFQAIPPARVEELRAKYGGNFVEQGEKFQLKLVVGQISEAKSLDDAKYQLFVNTGKEKPLKIVATIKKDYPESKDLIGKNVVVLTNIKPTANSEAMVLTASKGGVVGLLTTTAPVGTSVVPASGLIAPAALFDVRKQMAKVPLNAGDDGKVLFGDIPLVADKAPVVTENKVTGQGVKFN